MKLNREMFIPKNSTETKYDHLNLVTYSYEKDNKFFCRGFSGKKSKPDFKYYFSTAEQRENYVNEWIGNHAAAQKIKDERKSKRLSFIHTLKVGDILECSWGWEQTNVDFYQVIELVGKKQVKIRAIKSQDVEYEGYGAMTGKKMPLKDDFLDDEIMLKKVGEGNSIRMTSYSSASLWDGRPCRYSWYG